VIEITAEDVLYRRINRSQINDDGTVNSGAFNLWPGEDALSVDLGRLTTPERSLDQSGRSDLGVAVLPASIVFRLGLAVDHDPLPGNGAHCLITGHLSKTVRRQLAAAATVVIPPSSSSH
jgi:hypothetical protein